MEGWIKLYRKIMDNPYYFAEKFCRGMAWVDLLLLANHEDGMFYKRGVKVNVKRGQLGYDIDTLGKRWKWSRGKVERWLFELEKSKQIVRQKTNVTTLITITNYDLHQGHDNPNDKANSKPNSKTNSKANEHEQECKEGKEGKELNVGFDVFWNLYGRKQGNKNLCIQRWGKLKDVERQKIIDTLPAFKKSVSDQKYLPYPEKYLNTRRWEDEITVGVNELDLMP